MPKSRGSRGQHHNRNKPRNKTRKSQLPATDNFRASTTQKKRTNNKDLISALKGSFPNPENVQSLKKVFLTNGNAQRDWTTHGIHQRDTARERPDDDNNKSKYITDGAGNHRLSAEYFNQHSNSNYRNKLKGSIASEFGNSRKPDDSDTLELYSMRTPGWNANNFTFARPPGMPAMANANTIALEPRLGKFVEGKFTSAISGNAQHPWYAQRNATTSDD